MIRAFLDTCVLFKSLLSIAEDDVYRPLWSADVLEELRRNLVRSGVPEHAVEHRLEQMRVHFPGAEVAGCEDLVDGMANHHKDRHVLAAAVRGNAEVIVTEDLRDFPPAALERYDVAASHQDEFLLDLYDLSPGAVFRALTRQVSRYRRDPRSVEDLLIGLGGAGNGCPQFAEACHFDRFDGL
ncbi:PIN domain-containing protein [Saccharopolyspora kobensis]|uniref:PIN domain-containing protein n=1 Tax=Saccharopolyspora kobensis TaxID=146035 RepID=A0A1H6BU64_9PSEU|nr:PIN domain-containing protein [Saccharopolyspora kobensis]SEG64182.1 PIN domain-containing protein [Saccharopolyspora kobensis]SFC16270.1 PIN domain-containing protein [Saccharopolyspora kobensis]